MNKNSGAAPSNGSPEKIIILILLIVAVALRIWNLPAMKEVRDWDELGYVTDGLVAWEGIPPGWESTPAGPQAWVGWAYIGARSGWEFLHTQRKASTPGPLKPLYAMDDAMFKTYEDLGLLRFLFLWISIGIALGGVYGAYRLGAKYGGAAGGLLIGGLAATLPLYIEYAGVAKTCSDAWMLAILAVSCAATLQGPKRCWWAGTMLGLAIGSRMDMLAAVPLVLWGLWDSHEKGRLWRAMAGTMALTVAITVLSAPFIMQGFVGLCRNLTLAGGSSYWGVEPQRMRTLTELGWDQGLAMVLGASFIGMFLFRPDARVKHGVLAVFALILLAALFVRHHQPVRYNGGALIAVLAFAAVAIGALFRRWPKPAFALALVVLALPAIQSVRQIIATKALYVPDGSTEWVDAHIPAGTTVYVHPSFISRAVLPTEAAADAIWAMLTGNDAWRTKLEDGFHRFSLREARLPRTLSEDNLAKDRGFCRRWFILGGGESTRPRFDVRLIAMSATFGLQRDTLGAEYHKTGGVVIWPTRASGLPGGLGEPFKKWVNNTGDGVLVFVSDDLRKQLKN